MCGTPHLSRTMRTGALSPSTAIVPETWGCGHAAAAGGAAGRHAETQRIDESVRAANCIRITRTRTLFHMALKDGLLAEFDHEMATTRKLLERIPDDKLSWKPHA